MMREIQEKQNWISTLLAENEETTLEFVGRFNLNNSPEEVAHDIREVLGIRTEEAKNKPLKYWIDKAEKQRIFVSLSSNFHTRMKLDSEEVKGFAIADKYAPFVFLNSSDWDNAKLFTFVHELVHIWINQTGISNDTEYSISIDDDRIIQIERFCNEVAANTLLPTAELTMRIPKFKSLQYSDLFSISKHFGVGIVTLIIRLLKLGLISKEQCNSFKATSDIEYQKYILQVESKKNEKAFADPYYTILNRNGKIFSQIVLNHYKGGQITGLEASKLLNMKIHNFPKFEIYLYK